MIPATTLKILTVLTALGAGVTSGVYFAFSTFIMPGLRALQPAQGMRAMQSINKSAITPLFMLSIFGTALIAVFLIVVAVRRWGQPSVPYLIGGSVLYLISVIITVVFNVPRNDSLAGVDAGAADAASAWATYASEWTAGNHVRTVAAIAGTALLVVAALRE